MKIKIKGERYNYNVEDFVANKLLSTGYDCGGALEEIEQMVKSTALGVGRLVDMLLQKGLLSKAEIAGVADMASHESLEFVEVQD